MKELLYQKNKQLYLFFCSLAPNNFIWFNKLTKSDLLNIPALFATVCFGSSPRSALGDLIHTKDNSCDFYTTIQLCTKENTILVQFDKKKVVSSHHQDILTNYLY